MTIAPGFHLFPFRTEKLSPVTPMVLRNSGRVGSRRFGRVGSRRFISRAPAVITDCGGFFYVFLPAVSFFPGMLPGLLLLLAPSPSAGILLPVPFILHLALPVSRLLSCALWLMRSCRRLWPCWRLFNARQCQSSSGLLSTAQVDN